MGNNFDLTDQNIADLMRSVNSDEAENIRKELKESLRVAMEILSEIVYQWNLLSDDGDRGIGNDAIALILHDDGSGKVCTYFDASPPAGEILNPQIPFDDIAEGVEGIAKWF